ncbi:MULTISPECIES: dihydroxyacetone kinase phosphoryl donor subunit DhaM [Clostridium]|uniref:phosphoenolpyruvate--glycerone phosphotransferase n=1 Tax=Clostridium botulinum (strain Eklund 17B / Type B) TaxID=935198 RepID=B2THX0_CLOBB|nr:MULTISPECIES: dihydroxyacetone kinase phosphoryl donor subunit DhaM [Clostridium]ACD22873.1 dihydroxyacetone kinase, phosphotransfer subunit [Clostridium botulinum B str. Eklund 17B (NRP)]MBN1037192.1 PTS-dependent dihydroxyacetone kinase phosphotransferase subunit DhaM [Clostridium botulinum]MBN1043861.1 PTS-dependent dihydroxyacetone kinase phosphotransferase subunit DhaM [Clostridium botulinum]MBN1050537.1 PTS-dependent dihydroxyacetone kinase phosphotransferase subunit DhaM [Clostridium 
MVGIVIVSHSNFIAKGVREVALEMAPEVLIVDAGGTSDGRIGTDISKITSAIESVYSDSGVLVLFDLGSAFMNTEMAIEFLDDNIRGKVEIIDAPLVEGAITAAVEASMDKSLAEIKEVLKPMSLNKIY